MRPSWTMLILLIGVLLTSSGFGLWDCMINNGGQTAAQGGPYDHSITLRSSIWGDDEYFGRVEATASRIIVEIQVHTYGGESCNGNVQTDWDKTYSLRGQRSPLNHRKWRLQQRRVGLHLQPARARMAPSGALDDAGVPGVEESQVESCDLRSQENDCLPFIHEP